MVEVKIRDGYKKTEVGIIPEDWDIKSLNQIGVFSKGKGIKKDESRSGTIPCVRYGEIYTFHSDYIKNYNSFISREIAKTSKQLIKGDLLFAGSGETKEEIGKCVAFIDDIEAYVGGDVIILSPKFGEPLFWGYLLNAPFIVKQKSSRGQGDAIVHIYASSLSDILVPIPQLTEQINIAKSLVDNDKLLQSLKKLIDKKNRIKQGTMQQLLTGKKRLPGFSGEWVVKKLGDIVSFYKGKGLSKAKLDNDGKNKCLLYGELFTTYNDVINDVVSYTNYFEGTPSIIGDILIPVSTTTTGIDLAIASTINIDDVLIGGDVNILRPFIRLNSEFLSRYLTNIRKNEIFQETQGITIIHLYGKNLFNIEIDLPKYDEQCAISKVITNMDSEIESLQQKLEKYKKIKQGMMQELLTGRIRLI